MSRTGRFLAVATAAVLVLAGCSKGHNASTLSPSQLFQKANQQLCGVESKVSSLVSDVSSGTISSTSDISNQLGSLQTQLDDAANSFKKHGFNSLSSNIKTLSAGVGQLKTAVTGSDTAGIVAAAATIASALTALPACPGGSPSP